MHLLRDAIVLGAAFAAPAAKERVPLAGVRLIPRSGGFPARVLGRGRDAGILIDIEDDVPNVVADAVGLVLTLQENPDIPVTIEGEVVVAGSYRFQPWCSVAEYPGFPPIPKDECFQAIGDTTRIPMVLHALSQDNGHPELGYVSFRPSVVEATDGRRIARVPIAINRTVQVHPDVFDRWPGGYAKIAVEDDAGVVFRFDGELRWGRQYRGGVSRPYPDLSYIPDDRHPDVAVVVPVSPLKNVVRRAMGVSPDKVVACRFRRGYVEVASVSGGHTMAYAAKVPALCGGDADLTVSGSLLLGALTAVGTPRVMFGLQGPGDSMIVRSGPYVEHIYPIKL
jgi:hypothetical protein